jgi:hypothetical protein
MSPEEHKVILERIESIRERMEEILDLIVPRG